MLRKYSAAGRGLEGILAPLLLRVARLETHFTTICIGRGLIMLASVLDHRTVRSEVYVAFRYSIQKDRSIMLAGLSATGSRATTWKTPFGLYMRRGGKALEKGALALQRPLVLGPWRVSCKLVEFLCIVLCIDTIKFLKRKFSYFNHRLSICIDPKYIQKLEAHGSARG